MSFSTLKEWAESNLAPHASIMLAAMESPLSDGSYTAVAFVIGGEAAMRAAVQSFPASGCGGSDSFMVSLHGKFTGNNFPMSVKQQRAVANTLRHALRGEVVHHEGRSDAPYKPAPPSSPVTHKPFYDPKTKVYKCFKCGVELTGIEALYKHREEEHGDTVPAKYRTVSPTTSTASAAGAGVLPAFTPKLNLDLSVLPDGRYALANNPETGKPWFVIKRTTKRPYVRNGRFIWGRGGRRYENVEKGRIELRVQVGDTKELIGEQKPGESIYYGEKEDLLAEVIKDAPEAMRRYGILIGCCAYCGRSLTDDLSRLRGIGPDCWEAKHLPFMASRRVLATSAVV
jgi:hypothetical protein